MSAYHSVKWLTAASHDWSPWPNPNPPAPLPLAEVLTLEDLARLKSGLKRSHRRPARNLRNVHQRSHRSRHLGSSAQGAMVLCIAIVLVN